MFVGSRAWGYTVIVGRGRTAILSIALVLIVALAGACSSSGSSKSASKRSTAAHARAVAAARARKAARHRRVVARRRAVQRRRARLALALRRQRARRANAARLASLRATPQADLAAITRSVNRLNAAFGRSVRSGIARAAALNYWVAAGVYTRRECRAFAANAGEGLVEEQLVLHPETLTAIPGWFDSSVGRMPNGRLYAVGVDEIQTFVPTGEQRVLSQQLRAAVGRDGRARLFFRCA
jgi:hypothetical protein